MRTSKTLIAATVFAVAGFAASAQEAENPTIAAPERSISSAYILLGLLSALMIWAAIDAQD